MSNSLVISNRKTVAYATYFQDPDDLYSQLKEAEKYYRYDKLIFAFWSWKVPKWMLNKYQCYGLHTGPLLEEKGRGGSPIENLQALNVQITTLCAFKMTEKIDEGPVVLAVPLRLTQPKEWIVRDIDKMLPLITEYIEAEQPEIPERFKRIVNV